MIFKKITGSSFAGALSYVFNDKENSHDRATLIATNCYHDNPLSISKEMERVSDLRRSYSKPVHHIVMSHNESLTAEQWQETAQKYMQKMGYGDRHQYALVHHNDKDHDHCHLIINGVGIDGKGFKNSHDYAKQVRASKEISEELGLTPLSKDKAKKLTGNEHVKAIQDAIDVVLSSNKSIKPDEFEKQLKELGVTAKRAENSKGIQGYSFKLDGSSEAFTGKRLGADYKLSGLEARGLDTGKVKEQVMTKEQVIAQNRAKFSSDFDLIGALKKDFTAKVSHQNVQTQAKTVQISDVKTQQDYEDEQAQKQRNFLARAEENDARIRQRVADSIRLKNERSERGMER